MLIFFNCWRTWFQYAMKTLAFSACFIAFYTIISLSVIYINHKFDLIGEFAKAKIVHGKAESATKFLFDSGFDEESCLSRYQSFVYRKHSPHKPSPYLLSKLRSYEILHKRCGPYTGSYNQTLKAINSVNISSPTDCNYIVWTATAGLGNRILSVSAAFLYAVLTNRVLLVEYETDMANLFCEPFPNTSWLLPQDFLMKSEFRKLNHQYPHIFQNLIRQKIINASTELLPSVVYILLAAGKDKIFYCEEQQQLVQKIPWLILKSDEYFIPSLFLIPSFKQELDSMFPDKETVFHFLGRYLFNPSNEAWGLITRFYEAYLSKADQKIGMQIRVFNPQATPFQILTDQILACSQQENLLAQVDENRTAGSPLKIGTSSKSILIASLYSEFYEEIRNKYWRFPTRTGESIGVYQLSHEENQRFGDNMHNMKAWVEINLLSMSNVLVTSPRSTFGYVAQGLGGLKPWILKKPEDWKTNSSACGLAMSIEPCFHDPPLYGCKSKVKVDSIVPHIKHCEDVPGGLKLFSNYNTTN
ncbi:galactoside 2-alpha-L-fucosyltransferase-like [Jatropha curcas]|uniref:galactoside 2-alpha-L-fucosyltransferase-like n=1 Tax=Jatropha curcas TaxID=180498 RepID=UPI0009D68E45|nr:galactoside 2-alpha-L-fucosyltransferase-like [Jatropha curcas]